jgi:hypothetical protein
VSRCPSDTDVDPSDVLRHPRTSARRHTVRHSTWRTATPTASQLPHPTVGMRTAAPPSGRGGGRLVVRQIDHQAICWTQNHCKTKSSADGRPTRTFVRTRGRPDKFGRHLSDVIFPKTSKVITLYIPGPLVLTELIRSSIHLYASIEMWSSHPASVGEI